MTWAKRTSYHVICTAPTLLVWQRAITTGASPPPLSQDKINTTPQDNRRRWKIIEASRRNNRLGYLFGSKARSSSLFDREIISRKKILTATQRVPIELECVYIQQCRERDNPSAVDLINIQSSSYLCCLLKKSAVS